MLSAVGILIRSMARRQKKLKPYGCAYCEEDFETRKDALDHVRERHPKDPARIVKVTRVGK